MIKLGHQESKGKRNKWFNCITIDHSYNNDGYKTYPAYCSSHNFFFNYNEEEKKLYNGKPCIFTDKRYELGKNYFYVTDIFESRRDQISLKACIRRVNKCYNIPVGTIVKFDSYWGFGRKNSASYFFKVKKENHKDFVFEVNKSKYLGIPNDEYLREFTEKLREEGFLVRVEKEDTYYDYCETITAFGCDKIIGISPIGEPFEGYRSGEDFVLFDWLDEFDKWSRSRQIEKSLKIDEIINILKEKEDE